MTSFYEVFPISSVYNNFIKALEAGWKISLCFSELQILDISDTYSIEPFLYNEHLIKPRILWNSVIRRIGKGSYLWSSKRNRCPKLPRCL